MSNYAVETVVCVMNNPHYRMHQTFDENYGIDTTHTAYHDTFEDVAISITVVAFQGAADSRVKFGKDIYTSPNIWETLGYPKPYRDTRQVFFVVELLQDPTVHGT